jgi:hypothetical protein
MGSVAEQVVRTASCPVLLVRAPRLVAAVVASAAVTVPPARRVLE